MKHESKLPRNDAWLGLEHGLNMAQGMVSIGAFLTPGGLYMYVSLASGKSRGLLQVKPEGDCRSRKKHFRPTV